MAALPPGAWGIDVGQCGVKAIRLQDMGGYVAATAFDYIEYPKILTQPDADPDQLTREALEQFLSRNSIRGDTVVISVPGQSGLARFVKLPPVEEKKIADIVRFEAKQQIPFPLEEVVWDYQKLGTGEVTDGFAMGTEIGLFALKRDMVFRYLQHFLDVNVEVHTVQMAPLALCNFVAYDLITKPAEGEEVPDKKQCIVALDIGTDNSNLVITDGDRIIWQRPIPLGGNTFTRALTKDMKLTFAKAEHLKRNAIKSPDLKKILASLKTVLNDFVGEVQRSLGYFTNTHRDAAVQYMIGLGNAFRLPGLQKYLQEKLQLEVRKFTKLERVQGDEVMAAPTFVENMPSFAVAYGLALQGVGKTRLATNLLPYEVTVERLVRSKKPWAVAAAACLLVTIAGVAYASSVLKGAADDPGIKAGITEVEKIKAQAAELSRLAAAEQDKLTAGKKAINDLAAGVDERWNWQLLHQYINLSLPQPNGARLHFKANNLAMPREKYDNEEPGKINYGAKAYEILEKKRFETIRVLSQKEQDDQKADELFMKRHLIQVSIEGISSRYTDDLSGFYRKIATKATQVDDGEKLKGMDLDEKKKIVTFATSGDKTGLDMSGWVIEIRGYTYHEDNGSFVEEAFLENLNKPWYLDDKYRHIEDKPPPPDSPNLPYRFHDRPKDKLNLEPKIHKHLLEKIKNRMSSVFIYDVAVVENAGVGNFKIAGKSILETVVDDGGGGAPVAKDKDAGGQPPPPAPPPPGPPPAPGQPPGQPAVKDTPPPVKNRSGWRPLGGIGGAAVARQPVGGQPNPMGQNPPPMPLKGDPNPRAEKGNGLKRTEFIILFVWREPFLNAPADPVAAPNPATQPAPVPPKGK